MRFKISIIFSLWKLNPFDIMFISKSQIAYDDVKKYSIIRYANDNLKMDTNFIYNPNDEASISVFSQKTSEEVLNEINLKILNFNEAFKIGFKDNYSFKAGKGLLERTKQLKNQIDVYGYPFQSSFLTSIFRGMRQKKFGILSSTSGGGKSRSSMANAINISCDRMYDWSKKQWVSTGEREPVLLISTELEQEEIEQEEEIAEKIDPEDKKDKNTPRGYRYPALRTDGNCRRVDHSLAGV